MPLIVASKEHRNTKEFRLLAQICIIIILTIKFRVHLWILSTKQKVELAILIHPSASHWYLAIIRLNEYI